MPESKLEAENRKLRGEVARLRAAVWGCSHPEYPGCGCPEALAQERDRLRSEVDALRRDVPGAPADVPPALTGAATPDVEADGPTGDEGKPAKPRAKKKP